MENINQLKKNIEEQKEINTMLFKSIPTASKEDPMGEKAEPILQQWREGSKKLKEMIKQLQDIELKDIEAKNKENSKAFINGYGEATKREITCSTYSRQQKKLAKDMLKFMS